MRKIALFTLLLAAVCIASAQEQSFDMKKFYLKGGYTLKGKNYLGMNDTKDANYAKEYWKNNTLSGYNLDLGSLFYINMLNLGEKLHVGIDVNYLTVNYMVDTPKDDDQEGKWWGLYAGSAVGPVITYNVTKSIAFDAYFKVNPTWISTLNFPDSGEGFLGLSGMKYKLGINAHLDFLLLSAEFNPGWVIMKNVDYSDEYVGNAGEIHDDVEEPSNKTPMPVFNFNIGFCF